ncbi:MAG: cyclic nucleotide-binding domain-containing protein [Bacteroidales bacterium]|jgi:CRP-like cAMP-binding protein|nr:cyclic nucleotide-binding domain-containing protein [Bacteroidales bacterium]MCI1785179.1 cyclic nucleotide-binding domain-containing protein [Bacteroidales bacterium]
MTHLQDISPRPILFIMGEKAHSRYFTEDAYKKAAEPKELVIIPGARHIDLYDGGDKNYIPLLPEGNIFSIFIYEKNMYFFRRFVLLNNKIFVKKDISTYLQQIVPLAPEKEEEVLSYFHKRSYRKNEFLFRQGQISPGIFFLEKGFARVYYYSEEGKDITSGFASEGSVMTAVDSFYQRKRTEFCGQLLEDSDVYYISVEELNKLVDLSHDFAKIAFHFLLWAVSNYNQYITNIRLKSSKEKYDYFISQKPDIFQRAPLQDIASYLGITRETLSRLRSGKE